jgi:mitochondrial fission protein ELM1
MLCEICAFFSPKAGIGCLGCVKLSVGNKTTQELEKTYADIVVSAGSAVAPVNKMVSCSLCAKSVVILRPNTPLRKFDLSILPAHDRISAKNTVTIKGALSYPFNIKEKTQDCQKFFNLTADKKIAFFLGGYLSDEKAYIKNLLYFSKKLKDFSLKQNYKILISTSRRTQKEIENFIEQEFSNFKNLEALVYSNRQNYDFVFDGFAALSEIVFVSCESISMISEVISFKKPCVCVILEKHLDKHKVFLQSIENDVSLLDMPYDIQEIKPVVSAIFEDNKKAVKEGIRRLL